MTRDVDEARCPVCGAMEHSPAEEMHRIDCKGMTPESRKYAQWHARRTAQPLVEALEWAMARIIKPTQRLKQNAEYFDAYERAANALAQHREAR